MDEIQSAMRLLKDQLTCSFCNELASDPSYFMACHHVFCSEHISQELLPRCFKCHRGNRTAVAKADDVSQMIQDYKQLHNIFNELICKEQSDPQSDSIHEKQSLVKSKKNVSTLENKEIINDENNISPKENLPTSSNRRVLRNKNPRNAETDTNLVKTKSLNTKCDKKTKEQQSKCDQVSSKNLPSKKKDLKTTSKHPKSDSKKNDVIESAPLSTATSNSNVKVSQKNSPEKTCPNESLSDISIMNVLQNLSKRNNKGETALHTACVRGKVGLVEKLLEAGANPNTKDHAGWTPLHEAVTGAGPAAETLVKLLLAHGAWPSVPGPLSDTPLHEATKIQHKELAALLIKHGASLRSKNAKGVAPLDLATEDLKETLIKLEKQATPAPLPDYIPQQEEILHLYLSLSAKDYSNKLQKLCKHHKQLKVTTDLSKKATHILVEPTEDGVCRPDREALLAVAGGKIFLSCDWLLHCDESDLAPTEDYEISSLGGSVPCVKLSIVNNFRLLPGLWDGCHFYFSGFSVTYEISAHLSVKKQYLCQLVEEGKGVVLKREPDPESIPEKERLIPYHARPGSPLEMCSHYIIYQTKPPLAYNMNHIKSLPVGWLIDCLLNFQLIDP